MLDKIAFLILKGEAPVAKDVECRPCPGLTSPHSAEIQRIVGIAEAELLIRTFIIAHLPCKGNHVRGIHAVLLVLERESADPGLVGMGTDISVRHPSGHPHYAFVDILAFDHLHSFADEVHYPDLVLVCDGERLSA